jgi:hypothetical protein
MQSETLRKTLIIVVAIIIGTIIAVAITNSAQSPKAEVTQTENERMITVPIEDEEDIDIYTDFETEFVKGCADEGASEKRCQCFFNSLERQLGLDGIVRMSLRYYETEQLPEDAMTQAIIDCY